MVKEIKPNPFYMETEDKPPTVDVQLKSDLREFIDLTEQIQSVRDDMKILAERRKELELKICDFMVEHDIPAFNTPNGKISVVTSKSLKPLNKDYLVETLSTKIENALAKELCETAFSNRPAVPINKTRVTKKK